MPVWHKLIQRVNCNLSIYFNIQYMSTVMKNEIGNIVAAVVGQHHLLANEYCGVKESAVIAAALTSGSPTASIYNERIN